MPLSETEQSLATQAISRTVFDTGAWPEALRWLAKAGGGWAGQIVGTDQDRRFQFNAVPAMSPELTREFEQCGGNDPNVNPRARVFTKSPYSIFSDLDVASEDELRKSDFVQDFLYRRADTWDVCISTLADVEGTRIVAAVSRSRRQGRPDAGDRAGFAALLPHLHNSIRMRATLEHGAGALIAGALETLNYAAFVVDRACRIVALTDEAKNMLRGGHFVRSRSQRLEAVDEKTNKLFQAALWLACVKPGSTLRSQISSVFFRSALGPGAIADIAPLPVTDFTLRFGPVAVVAFGRSRPRASAANLLRQTFELTPAEADVALALLNGISTADIALHRGASTETVRKQIVSVFQKVGVNSRASLMKVLVTLIPGDQS